VSTDIMPETVSPIWLPSHGPYVVLSPSLGRSADR
jgi:hypothetical protein